MNIAYLDPPYSRYFTQLCRKLNTSTGGRTVALLSCPAYRLYARGDRSIVWQPGVSSVRHVLPEPFTRAAWASHDERFAEAFSHAVEWFKERFREEATDVCLLFSDARPFSTAAAIAAAHVGVVCLYFERGAFRLRTASLSTQGLNARFDLRLAARAGGMLGLPDAAIPARRREEPWLRARFALFMLLNELSCRWTPQRRPMQHKTYHFFNYVRIALRQFQSEHPELLPAHGELAVDEVKGTVLLPLQLQTDSQFVMYSPFRHNQELLDFIVPRVCKSLPGARVLVKKHPMDVRHYQLPAGAQFVGGNLSNYYHDAALMVCLNSGAGFEAAVQGKPVLCFADSFYTGHLPVVRTSKANFVADLLAAARRGDDPVSGAQLRAAVLRSYQAPGDVWAYTDDDLDASTGIVLQHIAAARALNGGASDSASA
ncbi:hypothetical protein [Caldimonas sp. KR1-144]|uniref:capsular polysaccharide export protein, LipB/KpsS family n=1 Tax=Caldimonas sp. KR1-144 TaxID=3400911 RepID=UPI003C04A6D8